MEEIKQDVTAKGKKEQTEETIKAFQTAIWEADKAARSMSSVQDNGSCNMDRLVIDFSEWRAKDINRLPLIGEKLTSRWWRGCRAVNIYIEGQANKRNAMVEAAHEVLRSHGVPSAIYYQLD